MTIITNSLFPPPPQREEPVQNIGTEKVPRFSLSRSWLKWFLGVQLEHQGVAIDTTSGPYAYPVPLANKNPGVHIYLKKVSADANMLSVARSGTNGVDGAVSQNVGTAIWSKLHIWSDGVNNWYIA